jgi:hypothetical protein
MANARDSTSPAAPARVRPSESVHLAAAPCARGVSRRQAWLAHPAEAPGPCCVPCRAARGAGRLLLAEGGTTGRADGRGASAPPSRTVTTQNATCDPHPAGRQAVLTPRDPRPLRLVPARSRAAARAAHPASAACQPFPSPAAPPAHLPRAFATPAATHRARGPACCCWPGPVHRPSDSEDPIGTQSMGTPVASVRSRLMGTPHPTPATHTRHQHLQPSPEPSPVPFGTPSRGAPEGGLRWGMGMIPARVRPS